MVPHQRYKQRSSIIADSGRKVGPTTLVVTWLFVVIFAYYVVHKPFATTNVLALLSAAADLAIYLLLFLLAASLGQFFLCKLIFDSTIERLILASGFGFAILALVSFGLGLARALNPLLFWGALVVGFVLLRKEVVVTASDIRAIRFPIATRFEGGLAAFVFLTLLLALTNALTPPLAWDALVYHLTEGKYWIAQGGITAPPDLPYFSFPSLGEMLYLGVMLLKGDTLAEVIHWGFFALTLPLTFVMARKYFSACVGWVAAACCLPLSHL